MHAQSNSAYTITGTLTDSLTGTGEAYATLRILQAGKDNPVKVSTTNEKGQFRISVPRDGKYQIQFTAVGKQPLTRDIIFSRPGTTHLGTLKFQSISTELSAATVVAQRPMVKAEVDRITYSMKDDPEAQTNNLLEMLRKVPMVTVDGEDQIKIKGNSNFKIHVNGKPNNMMSKNPNLILKSFPASAVKKIEVITDPGAKYDAEGTAGILNIVTIENTQTSGYTVTPNLAVSNTTIHAGAFGMVQLGRLMLSANYGYGHHERPTSSYGSERWIYDDPVNHYLSESGNSKTKGDFQFGSLEGSYEFDQKNLLSFSASLYGNKDKTHRSSFTQQADAQQQRVYSYSTSGLSESKYTYFDASVDFQHSFKRPEQLLTLSYRLNTNPSEEKDTRYYTELVDVPAQLALEDRYDHPDNHSNEHTAQIDFTTPLGKIHTLSTGVKYIYRLNKSDNEEWHRPTGSDQNFVFNDDASLRYKHRTDIGAAYTEYGLKMLNFSAKAGLRYEYSQIKVNYPDGKREAFNSEFNDWVPNASLGYNFSPTQLLKLGYNMRIGRPSIDYLSPYVDRTDPQNIHYGQPDLESEMAHNFSLSYSCFGPKLSVNTDLSYALSNNKLTPYSFMENGIRHTTYANMMHSKVTSLSLFFNWTVTKTTNINMIANGNYSDLKVYRTGDRNNGFSGNCSGGIRQTLPGKFKLGFWGGYFHGGINLQGKGANFSFYSVNLSRSFLADDALTVTLNARNFIHPTRKSEHIIENRDFRFRSYNEWDDLSVSVGIRYRLGKLKAQVKKASRTIVNTDVVGGNSDQGKGQQQSGM